MTHLELVEKIPEKYPNESEELNYLRAFTGAIARAVDLGYIQAETFHAARLAGETVILKMRGEIR